MQTVQRTAKIYQFPTRLRASAEAGRRDAQIAGDARLAFAPDVLSGAGWYHDAAIRDVRPTGKH